MLQGGLANGGCWQPFVLALTIPFWSLAPMPFYLRSFLLRSAVRRRLGQVLGGFLLAAMFTLPSPLAVVSDDAGVAYAQGGMDLGILSPSFQDLPYAVQPGEEFAITAVTAPGARCAGWIVFRNHAPVALESQAAPSGTCSWPVTVPPTARHGTANIGIEITRSGQSWALYGVTFVRPVGEGR